MSKAAVDKIDEATLLYYSKTQTFDRASMWLTALEGKEGKITLIDGRRRERLPGRSVNVRYHIQADPSPRRHPGVIPFCRQGAPTSDVLSLRIIPVQ